MLRDYQEGAIVKLRDAIRSGHRKPIMALPTGGGKSHIFGQIISNAFDKGHKVLWLVHRRNLVYQMRDVLWEHFNIESGIIMSGVEPDLGFPVQLSTIQTYYRRITGDPLGFSGYFIPADLVLIDEGHRSLSKTYKKIIDMYEDQVVMACTATPLRADGRGMGEVYDCIIDVASTGDLIDSGYLSPVRYFVPHVPDLQNVRVHMGDYVVKDLDETMNRPKLTGDVVDNWLRHAENRKTIVFGVNVKHSIALREEFERHGVNAAHLDARSSDDERDEVFAAMERGDITVICNVALYQEGLDVPDVSCIVMARPTKSLGLFRQCGGRGLRVSPGKQDCLFFDHAGVLKENGFLEDPIEWKLDGKEKGFERKAKPREKKPVVCQACSYVFEGSSICPRCGSPVKSFGKTVETIEAEMRELDNERKMKKKKEMSGIEKRVFYGMLLWYYREVGQPKGWKSTWVVAKYKDRTGVWPRKVDDVAPIRPDQNFLNWIRSRNIRYARRKNAEQ